MTRVQTPALASPAPPHHSSAPAATWPRAPRRVTRVLSIVAGDLADAPPARDVEDPHRACLPPGGGEPGAVGAKRRAPDLVVPAAEAGQPLARPRIPDLDRPVEAAGGQAASRSRREPRNRDDGSRAAPPPPRAAPGR